MSEAWQDENNRYLAASLEWLRVRLERLVEGHTHKVAAIVAPQAAPTPAPDQGPGLLSKWLTGGATAHPKPVPESRMLPTPEPAPGPPSEDPAKFAAARDEAAKIDPPPALVLLEKRLALSEFERDTLLLCAAVEYDPGFSGLFARVQGNPSRNYPTFGIALAALDDPRWEALAAHRPLRQDRLIEINQPGATPLTSSALRADERIVNFLKGLNILDERLAIMLTPVDTADAALSESQHEVAEQIVNRLHDALQDAALPAVQLIGTDPGSKLAITRQVCAILRRQLFRAGAESLPQQPAEIETLARLWQRETLLLPVSLYLDSENLDAAPAEAALERFLSRGLGLVFLGVRDAPVKLSVPSFSIEVLKPTPAEQLQAWSAALPDGTAASTLAGQFNLNLDDIATVVAQSSKAAHDERPIADRVWDGCRDLGRPRLDQLAQRLDVKATWDDLILPEEQMNLMRGIAGQVRERHHVYSEWGFSSKMNRGFGISALFAGESGTGKTMAAEVIASDLRLNLYRIDLSAVVSKFLGETEKNLRRLFDAAEQGGVILFFDEADALFGKRSEVKDSHDRYANIEINYLLQRMEAFSGLAILATNMKSALDPAFIRRLRFIVNFQFPGVKERKLIWQKSLPEATPKEALDFDRLAKLGVTGGNIHSIALNAAFLASQNKQPVSMPLLLNAARMELRKLDRPFSEAEFRT
jgi:hypothetical protein